MLGVFSVTIGSLLGHSWVTSGFSFWSLYGSEGPVESLGVAAGALGVPSLTLGAPLGSLGGSLVPLRVLLELPWSSTGCVLESNQK